eukprot:TRINITY_DN2076_c0_g1_i1.p1 TRINITY_DN2076_c0_g1~~TRINITY_DN2076_c0_g1_i1.p1  ORF type:complete len:392 (+),score=89.61 TRINITY_DN2076_c0_g1_i1:543-1718(+)
MNPKVQQYMQLGVAGSYDPAHRALLAQTLPAATAPGALTQTSQKFSSFPQENSLQTIIVGAAAVELRVGVAPQGKKLPRVDHSKSPIEVTVTKQTGSVMKFEGLPDGYTAYPMFGSRDADFQTFFYRVGAQRFQVPLEQGKHYDLFIVIVNDTTGAVVTAPASVCLFGISRHAARGKKLRLSDKNEENGAMSSNKKKRNNKKRPRDLSGDNSESSGSESPNSPAGVNILPDVSPSSSKRQALQVAAPHDDDDQHGHFLPSFENPLLHLMSTLRAIDGENNLNDAYNSTNPSQAPMPASTSSSSSSSGVPAPVVAAQASSSSVNEHAGVNMAFLQGFKYCPFADDDNSGDDGLLKREDPPTIDAELFPDVTSDLSIFGWLDEDSLNLYSTRS